MLYETTTVTHVENERLLLLNVAESSEAEDDDIQTGRID